MLIFIFRPNIVKVAEITPILSSILTIRLFTFLFFHFNFRRRCIRKIPDSNFGLVIEYPGFSFLGQMAGLYVEIRYTVCVCKSSPMIIAVAT